MPRRQKLVRDLQDEVRQAGSPRPSMAAVRAAAEALGLTVKLERDTSPLPDRPYAQLLERLTAPRSPAAPPPAADPALPDPAPLPDRTGPLLDLHLDPPEPDGSRPLRQILVHQEILDWCDANRSSAADIGRLKYVLPQLAVAGHTRRDKGVMGPARGWRRTPFGGNGGNQFYLWWCPGDARPAKGLDLPATSILIRSVRHHDETDIPLDPGSPARDYTPLPHRELMAEEPLLGDAFTPAQRRLARSRRPVKLVKGYPGTGKTTALLLSGMTADVDRAVYVTFSQRLCGEAAAVLRGLGPATTAWQVTTFDGLVERLLGRPVGPAPVGEAIAGLTAAVAGWHLKLKEFRDAIPELYAELYAHALGRSLPFPFRGQRGSERPLLDPADYEQRRNTWIGAAAAHEAAETIRRLGEQPDLVQRLFPLPVACHELLVRSAGGGLALPDGVAGAGLLAVDEVQDLTPLEFAVLAGLYRALLSAADGAQPGLFVAGDEGQTVLPTDFDWNELADMLAPFGEREELGLDHNLRAPHDVVRVVSTLSALYRHLGKEYKPGDQTRPAIDDAFEGRVCYVPVREAAELRQILDSPHFRGLSALVYPGMAIDPEWAPAGWTDGVPAEGLFSAPQVKGLEFATAGVVNLGRLLARLADRDGSRAGLGAVRAKNLIDQARVAASRAVDRLALIEVSPSRQTEKELRELCAGIPGFREIGPADLLLELDEEERDPRECLAAWLSQAEALADRPDTVRRGFTRADQAIRLLRRNRSIERSVRSDAYGRAAAVLLRYAVSPALAPPDRREEVLEQAATAADRAGLNGLREAARWLQAEAGFREKTSDEPDRTVEAVRRVAGELGNLPGWLAGIVVRGVGETLKEAVGPVRLALLESRRAIALLDRVEAAGRDLPPLAAELGRAVADGRVLLAGWLHERSEHREALKLLKAAGDRPDALGLEARCHEAQGDRERAIEILLDRLSAPDQACACARRGLDFARAAAIAREHALPEAAMLEAARELSVQLGRTPANLLSGLNDPEARRLHELAARAGLRGGRRG